MNQHNFKACVLGWAEDLIARRFDKERTYQSPTSMTQTLDLPRPYADFLQFGNLGKTFRLKSL